MTWTVPADFTTGRLVTASDWNAEMGTTGNMAFLKEATAGLDLQRLLTNGGFEINQRGGTVTANNAYAHDRWQIKIAGTSTFSITNETTIVDTGSGASLKNVYVHNSASQIDQKIEDYLQLRGKTVTFTIRIRQGVSSTCYPYIQDSGSKTYGATSTTTGSFVTLSVTLAIGASATSVTVGVEFRATDTCYLDNAMLVVGDTAPQNYAPLHPAEDLARCQRYYEIYGGTDVYERLGIGQCSSATATAVQMFMQVQKAVAPTLTAVAASNFRTHNAALSVAYTGTSVVVAYPGKRSFDLTVNASTAGFVAGNGSLVCANNTAITLVSVEANP